MRVLVVNWRDIKNPEAGGAEIYIDEILKRKPKNWKIDFVSAKFSKNIPEKEDINTYKVYRISNNFLFNFGFKKSWKKNFSKNQYDLVIDGVSKIPLATSRYIKNTPILALHFHVHGKSMFKELPFPLALYVYLSEKHYMKYYINTPIVSISESSHRDLFALYPFKNIRLVKAGIDFQYLNKNKSEQSNTPTLLYLGRLKKYKRVDHIMEAFVNVRKKYPDSVLKIGGKGSDEARLKEIAKTLGLSKCVKFLGFVPDEMVPQLYSEAWVTAIASEKEGWGITVLEANAAGCPVVGYNVEGLRDSIKDGYSGILVKNGDTDGLAEAIIKLISNGKLRERYSKNAETWASEFSWDKTAADFYRIAEETIRNFRNSQEANE